ncbi:MAG: hypothetical protein DCF22_23220 [Leptolyngbya sp.]|nr:MAG: hypothetical protein DCF22_23220 [Leptolyngbya sp.]
MPTSKPQEFNMMPAIAAGNWDSGNWDNQTMPPSISLLDRLKALGLVALVGTSAVGTVLLGHAIWNLDREETLLPISETSSRSTPPLRDRMTVITPERADDRADSSQPKSVLPDATPNPRSRQSDQASLPRQNHGFGDRSQPQTIPSDSQASSGDAASPKATTAKETIPLPTAPRASITSTVARPKSPPVAFPLTAIANLLQSPKSSQTIANQPMAPVEVQPGFGVGIPSSTAQPPSTPELTPPGSSNPIQPIPAPQIAAPAQAPTAVAIGQQPPRKDGVYVERLTITGSTRFSPKELAQTAQRAIAPNPNPAKGSTDPTFLNRRLSPAELVQASEAITKLYTGKGYINSGAYVPAEVLSGNTPEIRVVEGKLETINVAVQPPGFLWLARPLSPNYVRRRLAKGIKTPLQIDQLIDVVKLLEQDPLIASISTELVPGATTGKSILNVKVRQATPLRVSASIDNSRSPSVGRLQQQATLSHANLLGLGDRLQVGFNRTEGSQGFNVGYSLPINAKNGTLSFSYGNSRGQVIEEPFQDLDIKSRSQTYEIAFRQPLKQTSTELFALSLRGTHYRSRGVFLESFNDGVAIPFPAQGSDENGETRVTALRFGQEWTTRSEKDVISLQSEFSLGINALNATVLDTPPDGRFFSWQGRGFWVHAFAPDTLFALKGQVQLANRPLVPVEQISIGGADTVRGYRTSTLLADSGWLASAEVYLPILRIPKWRGVLQVIPFLDVGQGTNRGDFQPSPSKLLSTGLGLQWKMGDRFRARLDWGIPLINDTAENGRSLRENFFFSVIFTP